MNKTRWLRYLLSVLNAAVLRIGKMANGTLLLEQSRVIVAGTAGTDFQNSVKPIVAYSGVSTSSVGADIATHSQFFRTIPIFSFGLVFVS